MRYINKFVKKSIVDKQNNKCIGVPNYICPLLSKNGGYFDESGYEIDHIIEHCLTQNNNSINLQALCPSCHNYKTKQFMKISKKYLIKYEYKDTSYMISKLYMELKELIIILKNDVNIISISNYINENKICYHICQFNRKIDCSLLIKYLANSLNINYLLNNSCKNNIFILI